MQVLIIKALLVSTFVVVLFVGTKRKPIIKNEKLCRCL